MALEVRIQTANAISRVLLRKDPPLSIAEASYWMKLTGRKTFKYRDRERNVRMEAYIDDDGTYIHWEDPC